MLKHCRNIFSVSIDISFVLSLVVKLEERSVWPTLIYTQVPMAWVFICLALLLMAVGMNSRWPLATASTHYSPLTNQTDPAASGQQPPPLPPPPPPVCSWQVVNSISRLLILRLPPFTSFFSSSSLHLVFREGGLRDNGQICCWL